MEQATEMVEHAKETITEMVYGAPTPEPLPRLQPFKAPLYKSAHGKEWLLSERDQLRLNTLHTDLTQRLQDAYGETAVMIPKLGHLDNKKKFEAWTNSGSASARIPTSSSIDTPLKVSGSQSARGPAVYSKSSETTPRRLTTPGVTPRTKNWGSDALCSRRGASFKTRQQSPFHAPSGPDKGERSRRSGKESANPADPSEMIQEEEPPRDPPGIQGWNDDERVETEQEEDGEEEEEKERPRQGVSFDSRMPNSQLRTPPGSGTAKPASKEESARRSSKEGNTPRSSRERSSVSPRAPVLTDAEPICGLNWEELDAEPTEGTQITLTKGKLSDALLSGKNTFTEDELESFMIKGLDWNSFVEVNGKWYRPSSKIQENLEAPGLFWQEIEEEPTDGHKFVNEKFSAALASGKTTFSQYEIDSFGLKGLSWKSYTTGRSFQTMNGQWFRTVTWDVAHSAEGFQEPAFDANKAMKAAAKAAQAQSQAALAAMTEGLRRFLSTMALCVEMCVEDSLGLDTVKRRARRVAAGWIPTMEEEWRAWQEKRERRQRTRWTF